MMLVKEDVQSFLNRSGTELRPSLDDKGRGKRGTITDYLSGGGGSL
jgi:hypothetical protein